MRGIVEQIYPAFIAFLLAAALTPLVRRIALRVGLIDRPDGHRKLQGSSVPLGGGVAILASVILTLLGIVLLNLPVAEQLQRQPVFTLGFLGAASLICLVGLLDDRFDLRGRQKFAAQVLAVFLMVKSGLVIERVELFGIHLELGLLATPLTMAWLLGAINALNLIDGIDGLAGTVGVILSITIAVLAGMTGHAADAALAWALAGGVLGFLIYNLPPARIYLGDAGSMLVGLALGVLAIRSSLKGPATVALAAPTAIWAVLMFDVLMAVFRRKLTGRSVYASDRSHLHHVLQNRGFSGPGVVMLIGLLCFICAAGALVSVAWKNEIVAVGTAAGVIATLIATGLFGRSEVGLFFRRFRNLAVSLIRLPHRDGSARPAVCSRFHGNREWELLWDALVDYADRFDLCRVQLNVSSPSIGEEYHALWERKVQPSLAHQWRTEIPLFQGELCVGRLAVVGRAYDGVADSTSRGTLVNWMSELIEGLRPFEIQMNCLLEEVAETAKENSPPQPVA